MKVTELQIGLDNMLVEKLDLMIDRMSEKRRADNLLLVEGAEGEGKTNMSIVVAKYVSYKTGREFNNKHIYFDVKKLIQDAQSTEGQIFIWDEPALSGLSTDWWRTTQKDLIKLLMVARKKRHFFIFNFTRFNKFNEYIVVDRAIGMIHMYSPDGIDVGYWAYFMKESLESLYYYWRSTKRKAYKKFFDFRGRVSYHLPKIIDETAYEREKDKAIMSIGGKPDKETLDTEENRRYFMKKFLKNWLNKKLKVQQKQLAEVFGVSEHTILRYKSQLLTENTEKEHN